MIPEEWHTCKGQGYQHVMYVEDMEVVREPCKDILNPVGLTLGSTFNDVHDHQCSLQQSSNLFPCTHIKPSSPSCKGAAPQLSVIRDGSPPLMSAWRSPHKRPNQTNRLGMIREVFA